MVNSLGATWENGNTVPSLVRLEDANGVKDPATSVTPDTGYASVYFMGLIAKILAAQLLASMLAAPEHSGPGALLQ
jgi:hypothetical protein